LICEGRHRPAFLHIERICSLEMHGTRKTWIEKGERAPEFNRELLAPDGILAGQFEVVLLGRCSSGTRSDRMLNDQEVP
jgi:hypothetical protein